MISWKYLCFPQHNTTFPNGQPIDCSRNPSEIQLVKSFIAPLNPRYPDMGAFSSRRNIPVRHMAEQRDPPPVKRPILSHTRPETHQNLIHTAKEQHDRTHNRAADQTAQPHTRDTLPRRTLTPNSNIRDTDQLCSSTCVPHRSGGTRRLKTNDCAFVVCKQTTVALHGQRGCRRV